MDNIYIYGAGVYGKRCYEMVINSGFKVTSFLVSKIKDNQDTFLEIPVLEYNPQKIDIKKSLIIIAMKTQFCDEVLPILHADGCANIQIFSSHNYIESPKCGDVLIFGAGNYYLNNRSFFYEDEIVGFIDNNCNIQYEERDEKKIYPPSAIRNMHFDYICVMSTRYAVEMTLQLVKLGVPEEKILSFRGFREKFYRLLEVRPYLNFKRPILFPKIQFDNDISKLEKLSFKPSFQPVVSIIIPVYNQFAYTYLCLKSILTYSGDEISYEIIVADDCSTDQTVELEKIVTGITVIHNKNNLRFLKNCNNAASYTKGRYILFLNNDTQVQPDWLKPLVMLIEKDLTIGMVGSKLIYPDGSLQEAGGIMWNDGSAWNYGHGSNPALPEYNYIKESDYISGASIMIRKDLWELIGGFDERFCPAYYEDSDLAFEVRRHGYKVVFQPASVVVHFEGKSNGTDITTGQKQYQIINKEKFYNKWKECLENEQFEHGNSVFWARDRSYKKKTILVFDDNVPAYDKHAGARTTFNYLKMFKFYGFNVKFFSDNFLAIEPYTNIIQQMGIEVLCGSWYAENWQKWIIDNTNYIDYIWINRPTVAIKYIDFLRLNTKAKILYYNMDLHFIRLKRQYEITGDLNYLTKSQEWEKKEFYLMRNVDMNYTISSAEKEYINRIDSKIPVKVMGIYAFPSFRKNIPNDFKRRKDIMFVGGFGHAPNVDAVEWFINNIFPIIKKRLKIKIYLVGSNPPEKIKILKSHDIIVTGYVSDDELERIYDSCRLVVVPLRFGAGVKGKLIEAMYNGVPIITTSVGAEGIPNIEEIIPIENDADSFAQKTVDLYENDKLLLSLSEKQLEYVKNNFSIQTVWNKIKDDLE